MSFDLETIYNLLPAIYRSRDVEQGGPLKALLSVIAEQVAVIDEHLAQGLDDHFIETCADGVVSYIGDLIGVRALHGGIPKIASPRAEVANTIGYRRRKGTAVMLEQLARDVTGWHARVVEFFQRLATTQYMNHIRRENVVTVDLRKWEPLERLNTPFDSLAHTIDVRRIARERGRHNIPNIGIFLWRLNSYSLGGVQPRQLDARRYFFSPLGNDTPMFTRPKTQEEFAGLATRMNVPDPISRRVLHADLTDETDRFLDPERSDYYGTGRSIALKVNGLDVGQEQIAACNLCDVEGGAWAHQPQNKIAIDPVLGRIAFPANQPAPADLTATFHHGFSADIGGGEYDRSASVPEEIARDVSWQLGVSSRITPAAGEIVTTLAEAVQVWNQADAGTTGVIAIMDSASYEADLSGANAIAIRPGNRLLIIAADWPQVPDASGQKVRVVGQFNATGCRPHLFGKVEVTGAVPGADAGQIFFNGLLVEGTLKISSSTLERLSLRHCTLVPGHALTHHNFPRCPREPSLIVRARETMIEIDHSITGGLRMDETAVAGVNDSIVDATSRCGVAVSSLDDHGPGGTLLIENSTLIGKVHATLMEMASNTIFFANLAAHDAWAAPVLCERLQSGCMRFSFVPLGSRTPRRYRCQPQNEEDASRVAPQFSSLRYGEPGYAQLSRRCASEISSGADDESEMGAFHDLFEPQRITNLRTRLDEYLRFGLEAGIFFEPQIESRAVRAVSPYGYAVDLCIDEGAEQLPGIGAGLI